MYRVAKVKMVKAWPVTINVPQDGGKTQKFTIDADILVLTVEEANQAISDGKDLLEVRVVGWNASTYQDENGQPIEYSEAAKKELLEVPYQRAGFWEALNQIDSGRAAPRKN